MLLPLQGISQAIDSLSPTFSTFDAKHPAEGQFFRFQSLYFQAESPAYRHPSKELLDSISRIIKSNPHIVWEVRNFTDCRGKGYINDSLSQMRAEEFRMALIESFQVPDTLIEAAGYGERSPLNHCHCNKQDGDEGVNCTEAEHLLNRRWEMWVIKVEDKK